MDSIEQLFGSLRIASSALKAERARIDILAQNIANAQTTRMPGTNEPYRRQVVSFAPILERLMGGQSQVAGVQISKISSDTVTPFERIHDPSHPHAGPDGIVEFPNVNVTKEMADLMMAVRSYEANLTVQDNFVQMAQRSLRLAE